MIARGCRSSNREVGIVHTHKVEATSVTVHGGAVTVAVVTDVGPVEVRVLVLSRRFMKEEQKDVALRAIRAALQRATSSRASI